MERRTFLKTLGAITVWAKGGDQLLTPEQMKQLDLKVDALAEAGTFTASDVNVPSTDGTYGALAILQGVTDQTRTQVNVIHRKTDDVRFRLIDRDWNEEIAPDLVDKKTRDDSAWAATNVFFSDLDYNGRYYFDVVCDDGQIVDRRELNTVNIADQTLKFSIISCIDEQNAKTMDEMWDSFAAVDPAMLFLIGDIVYGAKSVESVDPKTLWARYVEVRNGRFKLYHLKKLIPTVSIWDDHDYGDNDGDHTYKYKHEALEIFDAFYAQRELPGVFQRGPGCSSWYRGFGIHFQNMDARFFAGTPGLVDAKSQWGKEQEQWLFDTLKTTTSPVFLANGVQYFKTFIFAESFERDYGANQKFVFGELRKHPHPIYFVSGDVHYSEINFVDRKYIGYETFEITSSGMTKFRLPLVPIPPQSKRIKGIYKNNFVIVRNLGQTSGMSFLEVAAYGKEQKIYFKEYLVVRV